MKSEKKLEKNIERGGGILDSKRQKMREDIEIIGLLCEKYEVTHTHVHKPFIYNKVCISHVSKTKK